MADDLSRAAFVAVFDQHAADALEEARKLLEAGVTMEVLTRWRLAGELCGRAGHADGDLLHYFAAYGLLESTLRALERRWESQQPPHGGPS